MLNFLFLITQAVMKFYDPECVYIIGGLMDRGRQVKLTNVKAMKEGL